MHRDELDNVLLHLYGRKSVVVVEPTAAAKHEALIRDLFTMPGSHADLYECPPHTPSNEAEGVSCSRSSSISSSSSTKCANSTNSPSSPSSTSDSGNSIPRLHCYLEPGDLLYIPNGWFHDVESQTPTISAALRFDVGKSVSPEAIFASAVS